MHVYVHVPFCARRCSYCDFAIAVRRVVPSERYVAAIAREWEMWQEHPVWRDAVPIETIYFGGGTPSRLEPGAIARLIDMISGRRTLAPGAEITLETNPDDVTPAAAAAWARTGVNRISLGVQSFHPSVLAWMHRTHGEAQVAPAVSMLRDAGIGNISLDLIFGLPASLERSWARDLESALALDPTHLSLYGLTIEAHTPLAHWRDRREVIPVPEEGYAADFLHTSAALQAAGFEHYEVSNASRAGFRSRHNSAYWRRAPYIGLGPSAHSAFGNARRWNLREWEAYRLQVEAGASPQLAGEVLDANATRLEDLYLGLRTSDGAPASLIDPGLVGTWVSVGWAAVSEGRVRLSPEGWLRLDALVAQAA